MAYVDSTTITGAVSSGLIIASDAYCPDADFRRVEVKTDGVVASSYLRNGGELAIPNANGYVETIHISSGGYAQIKGIRASGGDIHISQGGWIFIQGGALVTDLHISSGGELRFHEGSVKNLTVESGGKVYKGALSSDVARTMENIYVHSGAEFTIYSGFVLVGDINIAAGALTNDLDASAVHGTIYDLDLTSAGSFGSGVTLSRYTQRGCKVDILSGATVESATLNINTTLTVSSGATVNDITQTDDLCTLNIASGASAENIIYSAGTFVIAAGGTVRNFHKVGGSGVINLKTGAVFDGGSVLSGTVQALSNNGNVSATIRNFSIVEGGAVIVRGITNLADRIAVSGGNLHIQQGAEGSGVIQTGGTVNVRTLGADGLTAATLVGGTVIGGVLNIGSGGIVSDTTISGGVMNLSAGGGIAGALAFDLTGKSAQSTALLAGAANLAGAPALRVSADQVGTYKLADADISTSVGNEYRVSINGILSDAAAIGSTIYSVAQELFYTVSGGTATTLSTAADFADAAVLDGTTSIISAGAAVQTAEGGTVYTGKLSVATTANYFAAGTDTGSNDIWLEVSENHSAVVAAGGNAGGAVGTGKVKVTGGSTLLLLGGGNTGATQSKAVVEVAGGEVGTLYGGGKQGGYANGIDVSLTGTATVNNIYAGVLHTSGTGNFTIGGEINLDVAAGSVTGFVFGGGKVSVSGSESVTFNNDINITVDGGTFGSGVYALGYAKGTDKTKTALTMASTQEVNVSITGGTFNSNVYLGALTDTAITSGASLKASVTGGKISGLYGGGLAQHGGTANAGAVSITVSGGEIDAIIGGGSHVNKNETVANTTTVASVAISVSGGSIGSIYAGGHYNDTKAGYFGSDTVTGDAVLTLSGDAEVGKAAGSWNGIDTVNGKRKLVFDDFTGTCGTVCDWDLVTFDGENATTADLSSATVYGVGAWSFDVIGREANAGTALVDIGDWFGSKATIDLHITDAATSLTTWSLAEFDGSLGELTFNVYDAASTELASGLALEGKITKGTFTNYGFSIDDATNTLKFGLLSA